jgi:hypothetical protein
MAKMALITSSSVRDIKCDWHLWPWQIHVGAEH